MSDFYCLEFWPRLKSNSKTFLAATQKTLSESHDEHLSSFLSHPSHACPVAPSSAQIAIMEGSLSVCFPSQTHLSFLSASHCRRTAAALHDSVSGEEAIEVLLGSTAVLCVDADFHDGVPGRPHLCCLWKASLWYCDLLLIWALRDFAPNYINFPATWRDRNPCPVYFAALQTQKQGHQFWPSLYQTDLYYKLSLPAEN